MQDKRVTVNAMAPESAIISRTAAILQSGGMVIFPTRCLYGLAVDAFNSVAVEKIFQIKRRLPHQPILVLIPNRTALEQLVYTIPVAADKIMERFWPGQVTIVFHARKSVPAILTAGSGKIGIRLPGHPVAAALVKSLNRPITGTSANISMQSGCTQIEKMDMAIKTAADLILDAGPLAGGRGSTVVDVTVDPPVIIREGTVQAKNIFNLILKSSC